MLAQLANCLNHNILTLLFKVGAKGRLNSVLAISSAMGKSPGFQPAWRRLRTDAEESDNESACQFRLRKRVLELIPAEMAQCKKMPDRFRPFGDERQFQCRRADTIRLNSVRRRARRRAFHSSSFFNFTLKKAACSSSVRELKP